MEIWTEKEEAERLKARFEQGVNRAAFAREFQVPGGAAMIYQHINGLRPISLDAALAYMDGFKCLLSEISPRLSIRAKRALAVQEASLSDEAMSFAIKFDAIPEGDGKVKTRKILEILFAEAVPNDYVLQHYPLPPKKVKAAEKEDLSNKNETNNN